MFCNSPSIFSLLPVHGLLVLFPSCSQIRLENIGLVKVFIDTKSTLKIVMTATVTVVDMISNIGGIMGLFCGISFLSLAEFLYWIGKLVAKNVY